MPAEDTGPAPGDPTPPPNTPPAPYAEDPATPPTTAAATIPALSPAPQATSWDTEPTAGPPDQPVAPSPPTPPAPSHPEDAGLPPKVGGGQRLWRALRAGASPKSVPAQQSGRFAKAVQPSVGDRYRLALQETDRCHNLEMLIRTAPLTRCMVIAVVSPKGGPGKTTLTALLGMLLAELRRDPVLALDANPDLGDLRDKLAAESAPATLVDDLARWLDEHPTATPAELSARLGVGPHGLRFVPTPRPPAASKERMIEAADFGLYQRLIARLRDYEGIILVDCGTGLLDPPVRAALEAADQIVLVTDSSATTARQVVAAAGLLPEATPTWLVANKMPVRGSTLDLAQVVADIPRLNGVTVVPVPGGRLAENVVTPGFTWAESPPSWREPIREIAARLANNWGTLH